MKLKKLFHNPYFMIVATYVLAHVFLLLLSGCWWDDWTFMTHNTDYIAAVAKQSGRPEWNLLVPLCWSLPNNGRILIFFLYLCDAVFVYRMLKDSELFSEEDSLIIALLFCAVPVDEARLLISNFAYSVGLFFFYLSFMLFVRWNKKEKGRKKNICRVMLLGLFYLSFILNSVLAYYYIVIAYLFVLELKKSSEERFWKKVFPAVKEVVLHYFDYCILPFIYYGMNKLLFPVSGAFANYNAVTFSGLIRSLICVPLSAFRVFSGILEQFFYCIDPVTVLLLAAVLFCLYRKESRNIGLSVTLTYGAYGLFVLVMGLFPYVMVRKDVIDLIGVKGRDAILVPLGFALTVYALLTMIKGKHRYLAIGTILVFEIVSCNRLYGEWQKDYYYQLAMQEKLDDPVIAANDTFFLTDLNESKIKGQRFYSLSANAYNVYGDETRLLLPKVSNLDLLTDPALLEETRNMLDHAYMIKDYRPDDLCLDAVIDFQCSLSDHEVLKMKYYEMTDDEKFMETIRKLGSLEVYVVDDDFTALLLDEYHGGKLADDNSVLELLYDYLD